MTAFLSHCRSTGHHPTTARYGRWVVEQEAGSTRRPYFDGVRTSHEVAKIVQRWRKTRFLSDRDQRGLMIALQNMRMSCNSTYLLDQGEGKPGLICLSYTWSDDSLKLLPNTVIE